MAILKAPLFSFEARGQIAKSLVFMGWKGLKTVRQHVTPSNPQSAGQTTQRNLFTVAVAAWRNFIRNTATQTSWNALALVLPNALSGFNAFMSAVLDITTTDPDASFATAFVSGSPDDLDVTMVNIDDGTAGDESGTFTLLTGTAPNSLQTNTTASITGGDINFVGLGETGNTIFAEVRKDGQSRSGIFVITIT